jgi:hypothetical protein
MTACDQDTGIALANTDVDGKPNEITRFGPLLDQLGDLRRSGRVRCQAELAEERDVVPVDAV